MYSDSQKTVRQNPDVKVFTVARYVEVTSRMRVLKRAKKGHFAIFSPKK